MKREEERGSGRVIPNSKKRTTVEVPHPLYLRYRDAIASGRVIEVTEALIMVFLENPNIQQAVVAKLAENLSTTVLRQPAA